LNHNCYSWIVLLFLFAKDSLDVFQPMPAMKVVVSGAAGQIGYALVPLIARGDLLGPEQHVILHLLDIEPALGALEGVDAELMDCAFPLLDSVVITADPRVAFDGVNIAILCGAFPRKQGMERKELLEKNSSIFSEQGAIMAELADPDCHILVVGNPANTNAYILLRAVRSRIKPENVTAMTRLDHNRSLALLASKAGVPVSEVRNVIIWGNHSSTQVPDVSGALIEGVAVRKVINDPAYFDGPFMQKIQQRGAEVIKLRGLSSAMSAAKAAVDHVHDWMLGTPEGVHVSMGVYTMNNPYGIPDGLIFSLPVICRDGKWILVEGCNITAEVRERINATVAELEEEKEKTGVSTVKKVYHAYRHKSVDENME